MEIIEIDAGSYIITAEDKSYALFRTNIPIRLDSGNLCYMVKVECEQEGYKMPLQAQVTFSEIKAGKAAGKTVMQVILGSVLHEIQQKWKLDFSALLEL